MAKETRKGEKMIAPMSGQEIAEALHIKRQAVSQSLKRGMRKSYHFIRKTWPELSPLSASIFLLRYLDKEGTVDFDLAERTKFVRLFPPDVRQEIEDDIEAKRGTSYLTILEQVNEIFESVYSTEG
jgi:hypothetical protein